MALTILNAHTSLAYRLGESAAPTNSTELARRLQWFVEAINKATSGTSPKWFMEKFTTDTTVADQPWYSLPTRFRKFNQIQVDNYKHPEISQEEFYEKYQVPTRPVPILGSDLDRSFYVWNSLLYIVPIPSAAPTTYSLDGITRSSSTVTVTVSEAHGYAAGDYVTIAGSNQSDYNGAQKILTVPSTTTFTFSTSATPTSPATGTMTVTERNIRMWYYEYADPPTGSSSSIVVPDEYLDLLVSYAEGRYWSFAHKRAKSADAFTEFEGRLRDLNLEDFRKKFYAS